MFGLRTLLCDAAGAAGSAYDYFRPKPTGAD